MDNCETVYITWLSSIALNYTYWIRSQQLNCIMPFGDGTVRGKPLGQFVWAILSINVLQFLLLRFLLTIKQVIIYAAVITSIRWSKIWQNITQIIWLHHFAHKAVRNLRRIVTKLYKIYTHKDSLIESI